MDNRSSQPTEFQPDEIRLPASIDERLDLSRWAGTEPGRLLKIRCADVTRLNSSGIHKWTLFFGTLRKKGVRLSFLELSPPVVEHASVLTTFIPRSEIGSIQIPYFCAECSEETRVLREVSGLLESFVPEPSINCRSCSGPASFDDDPEHYFAFLRTNTRSLP